MHVAIIGCGISGLLTALELLEQGCEITLIDQKQAAKAASWAGGGILSPMYPWRYPKAVNQLAQHGKSLYQSWNQKIQPLSGIDFEIHDSGMLIFDEDDFEIGLSYKAQYNEPMQHCDLLDETQLRNLNPRVSNTFKQALHFPQLSNVRNPRLLKSILTYLKSHSKVKIIEHKWVEKLLIQNQQVQSIVLHDQHHIKADQYVIATGAWSAHWASQLDFNIPVQPVQGQMILFKTPENWLPTMCMYKVMYMIPRRDGHIVCGSSMAELGFEHRPNLKTQQSIYQACIQLIPELKNFPIVQQWAGLRPSSPDGIPYIGLMPEMKNLWANFGHFRNGLCMGPAAAQLLRQLMLNQTTLVDPRPYNPSLKFQV